MMDLFYYKYIYSFIIYIFYIFYLHNLQIAIQLNLHNWIIYIL